MDLSTTYLGIDLKNPIVASASPLSYTLDGIKKLEDAGAAAVVLFSLFEEQITHNENGLDLYLNLHGDTPGVARDSFPAEQDYHADPEAYLELIRSARETTSFPIIGSLNGVSSGSWLDYALHMERAGANALELNLYYIPADIELTGLTMEWMYLDAVADVARQVQIPLSVKISPYFSAVPYMVNSFQQSGAEGLVLFNRFFQPELDIEAFEIAPRVRLSRSEDLAMALRWVSLLYGRVAIDFAVTGGVHTYRDVIKATLLGANVAMMAAELMQNGVGRIGEILREIDAWMEAHECSSIKGMRGVMSERFASGREAFARGSYTSALVSYVAPSDNR